MSSTDSAPDEMSFGDLPLHQYLTYRLSRVQAKLNTQGAKVLHDTVGLTLSQWRVIALVGAAGQTRLSDLARQAALDKGLLSRNVKTMIARGLVRARQDDLDNRVQHLSLTPEGKEVFSRALPVTRRRQKWLRAELTDDEIRTFRNVLDKLEIAAERQEF